MKQILKDRLLVEKVKPQAKTSILDIPESDNGPFQARVVKVGKLVEDIKLGDIVVYRDTDALPFSFDGRNFLILREYDIIGII